MKEINDTNSETKRLTIPNILSLFRICLIPVIVWLYLGKDNSHWAGSVLILSGVTDVADGFIARRFHMTSNLGKVLDPIADKLTQAAMLLCLMMRFPLMIIPFVLMFVKELFMTISGVWIIKRTGKVLYAKWHGKVATVLLYVMMFVHIFWKNILSGISACMIIGCTGMILLSFILYGTENLKILKEAN